LELVLSVLLVKDLDMFLRLLKTVQSSELMQNISLFSINQEKKKHLNLLLSNDQTTISGFIRNHLSQLELPLNKVIFSLTVKQLIMENSLLVKTSL